MIATDIVSFPIYSGDLNHDYVNLYQGTPPFSHFLWFSTVFDLLWFSMFSSMVFDGFLWFSYGFLWFSMLFH